MFSKTLHMLLLWLKALRGQINTECNFLGTVPYIIISWFINFILWGKNQWQYQKLVFFQFEPSNETISVTVSSMFFVKSECTPQRVFSTYCPHKICYMIPQLITASVICQNYNWLFIFRIVPTKSVYYCPHKMCYNFWSTFKISIDFSFFALFPQRVFTAIPIKCVTKLSNCNWYLIYCVAPTKSVYYCLHRMNLHSPQGKFPKKEER